MNWIWMLLIALLLVVIARYIPEGPIRLVFYVLAAIVAIVTVVRLTGIG
jgi:hypothetical protein